MLCEEPRICLPRVPGASAVDEGLHLPAVWLHGGLAHRWRLVRARRDGPPPEPEQGRPTPFVAPPLSNRIRRQHRGTTGLSPTSQGLQASFPLTFEEPINARGLPLRAPARARHHVVGCRGIHDRVWLVVGQVRLVPQQHARGVVGYRGAAIGVRTSEEPLLGSFHGDGLVRQDVRQSPHAA